MLAGRVRDDLRAAGITRHWLASRESRHPYGGHFLRTLGEIHKRSGGCDALLI
jgi:hypothetical protein